MVDYGSVLNRFSYVRPGQKAGTWTVRCPCPHNHQHGDRRPSGRVWIGREGGLRWWCAKGCKFREVLEATGTRQEEWNIVADRPLAFWPKDRGKTRKARPMPGKVVATYDYTDEAGSLLYQV